jgi:hypothetical protein
MRRGDADLRMDRGRARRRGSARRGGAAPRGAVPGLPGHRRGGAGLRAAGTEPAPRPRPRPGAVPRARPARRRLRHQPARSQAQLAAGRGPRRRRGRGHDGGGGARRALARARPAVVRRHRPRRHRGAAGRGGGALGAGPCPAAPPPRHHPQGREPVQRRLVAAHLPPRPRGGGDGLVLGRRGRPDLPDRRRRRARRRADPGAALRPPDALGHRSAERRGAAIRRHLRPLARRRAGRGLGRADGGELRHHRVAALAPDHAGPSAGHLQHRLGDGGVRAQRARLRADRPADRPDPRGIEPGRAQPLRAGRRRRVRHHGRGAARLGARRAGLRAARAPPGWASRTAPDRPALGHDRGVVRDARRHHHRAGAGAPRRLPAPRPRGADGVLRRARHAGDPGPHPAPAARLVLARRRRSGRDRDRPAGRPATASPTRRHPMPRRCGGNSTPASARRRITRRASPRRACPPIPYAAAPSRPPAP